MQRRNVASTRSFTNRTRTDPARELLAAPCNPATMGPALPAPIGTARSDIPGFPNVAAVDKTHKRAQSGPGTRNQTLSCHLPPHWGIGACNEERRDGYERRRTGILPSIRTASRRAG